MHLLQTDVHLTWVINDSISILRFGLIDPSHINEDAKYLFLFVFNPLLGPLMEDWYIRIMDIITTKKKNMNSMYLRQKQ